jgi:hypothetical protein
MPRSSLMESLRNGFIIDTHLYGILYSDIQDFQDSAQ